jgi:sec-independent protein translocase protein TatC
MSVQGQRRTQYDTVIKRRPFTDIQPPRNKALTRSNSAQAKPNSPIHKPSQHTLQPSSPHDDIDEVLLKEASSNLHKPYNFSRPLKKTIEEHVNELRKRALWCVIALIIGGIIGYKYQDQIIAFLVKPLGQQLFYSSPTGGLDFLVKICLFFGFLLAIPVIVYNLFRFIEPAIPGKVSYKVWRVVVISVLLAIAGASFAYFVSLPAALYFLNNISNEQVTSLISAQEYFNFVMLYMGGFAALFQMPLIFSFVNKVTPMSPKKLIKKQRVVILASFIIAAILTPTPDPINQVLMAAPIIGLYQTSVGVVWRDNKRDNKRSKRRR